MRAFTALPIALTMSLAAGASDSTIPTEMSPALTARQSSLTSKQQVSTPLTGTCVSRDAQPPVLNFPFLSQVITGTCHFSHLGRADMFLTQRVNVMTGSQVGQLTLIAADGDQVRANASGGSTPTGPNTFTFFGVTTITGGTGRFMNAEGQLQLTGTLTLDQGIGTASSVYDGWIAYAASDRSLP
jgi:hypothetical protein